MYQLLAAAFFFAAITACALPHVPARTVFEDSTSFVRLETDETVLPTRPETRHTHPVMIPAEQMTTVLKGLSLREHRIWIQRMIWGEAPFQEVFSAHEIAFLVPRLTEALAKANADERVTFYLSRPQDSIKREITSGGLYVKGNQLHFILGNHRVIYGIPSYGMVYDRRYPTMPTAPKSFDLSFTPADAVVKQRPGIWSRLIGRTKDEMIVNLQKIPAYGAATPLSQPTPAM